MRYHAPTWVEGHRSYTRNGSKHERLLNPKPTLQHKKKLRVLTVGRLRAGTPAAVHFDYNILISSVVDLIRIYSVYLSWCV